MQTSVNVAFTDRAMLACMNRFGQWELVLSWDEWKAVALGVDEAPTQTEKAQRLAEALRFFSERQGLDAALV